MGIQGELFEELTKPKKNRAQKGEPIAKQYRLALNISYEQLVFSVITLIMVMVLIFSLGVGRGRRLAALNSPKRVEAAPAAAEESWPEIEPKIQVSSQPEAQPRKPITGPPAEPMPQPAEPIRGPSKPYTIQVATYSSKPNAKKELEKLRRRGLDSFIISGNGKYEVCVGEYVNKDNAAESIKRLKKDYKDCFLRRR